MGTTKSEITKGGATPATITQVSFDTQLSTVQDAMIARGEAQNRVKQLRGELISMLHDNDISKRLDAGTNLRDILDYIRVNKPRPVLSEDAQQLYDDINYDLGKLVKPKTLKVLRKYGGTKLEKLITEAWEAYDNRGDQEDVQATKELREAFTAKFNEYQKAIVEHEDQATIIANAKEFVGFVKDVASISAVQQGK